MTHYPRPATPALAGLQQSLSVSACKPVRTITLTRTRALLILALAIAASGFLSAIAFGSALVAQHATP